MNRATTRHQAAQARHQSGVGRADRAVLACPACDSLSLEGFHTVDGVPTNCWPVLDDEGAARSVVRGRLDLAVCQDCGFITNRAFDADKAELVARSHSTQACPPTIVDFQRGLAKTWVDEYDLHGKHVLEISCGEGEFLVRMIDAGVGSGTGIDPHAHPEACQRGPDAPVRWISDVYDERYVHLTADAIVCRHMLAHVQPVGDFLRTLRANIGDRRGTVVLFEVPDTLRTLREPAFWDARYEHCSYFTLDSLERLFRSSGFQVLSRSYECDDQVLLIEAVPATGSPRARASDRQRDGVVTLARRFGHEMRGVADTWDVRLRHVAGRGGRVALWGDGPRAVAFLSALRDPSLVDVVVDTSADWQGKFISGPGHLVLSPGDLLAISPDLVVAMNPIHLGRLRQDLDELGLTGCRLMAV